LKNRKKNSIECCPGLYWGTGPTVGTVPKGGGFRHGKKEGRGKYQGSKEGG